MTTPAATAPRTYVLDANAFVEAHRKFYALDLCPGYWKALDAHHLLGMVGSIDRIRNELAKNHDPSGHGLKPPCLMSFSPPLMILR